MKGRCGASSALTSALHNLLQSSTVSSTALTLLFPLQPMPPTLAQPRTLQHLGITVTLWDAKLKHSEVHLIRLRKRLVNLDIPKQPLAVPLEPLQPTSADMSPPVVNRHSSVESKQ